MNKRTWIIIIIALVIIIIAVVSILIYKSGQFNFKPAFTETTNTPTVFDKYDMETSKVNGESAVKITNVVASTADNNDNYFKVDLTVVTSDKNTSKMLVKHHKLTYLVISTTMSQFKTSDVKSIKGKKFLKDRIRRELEKKYGADKIKAIYFENFIIS